MTQSTIYASDATPAQGALTVAQVRTLLDMPLVPLLSRAATVHAANFEPGAVQKSELLSIKTGGCPENCSYCSQSARHDSGLEREKMLPVDEVLAKARRARDGGADRFCLGAAWREVKDGPAFDQVLAMVRGIKELGLEACVTLGMLGEEQAQRLRAAGLDYYNHNIDTSPEHYKKIVTTHTFADRLQTLENARRAGLKVCSGGILGLGESTADRAEFLFALATQDPPVESVPINTLVPIPGTPLANSAPVDPLDWVRVIAVARILMPRSFIRLAAGRKGLDEATLAMAFLAGANSIFTGDRLLTTDNNAPDADASLFERLGLRWAPAEEARRAK